MRKGVTLIEMMVAVVVLSVGILGLTGSFKFFNIGIQSSKMRSLANNIAQERIEFLKNKSYYRILVTTATAEDENFDPHMVYDQAPNGSETVNIGGVSFTRRVYIQKVNENTDGDLAYLSWNSPDTGLKEIAVYIVWQERGEWKKLVLRNLINNPSRVNQSSTFMGRVTNATFPYPAVEGATVRALENPSQYGESSASGDYFFGIEPGSYTLLAMKEGFFSKSLPQTSIASDQTVSGKNFALTQMSSGTITGSAYMRDHLVISQVVGSCVTAGGSTEWVEVFNPTTWTWTMATGLGTGTEVVRFSYKEASEAELLPDIDYRTVSMAPGSYFLFANAGTITAAGVSRSADAVYDINSNWGDMDDVIKTGSPSSAGHVILRNMSAGEIYDILGWNATSNGLGSKKYAERFEGEALVQSIGFQVGEAYTRKTTSAAGINPALGRCYDSNNNNNDFVESASVSNQPHNSSDAQACVSGTPASGALVFATTDSLSSPAIVGGDGTFNLTNVGTGTWTVYFSSGGSFASSSTFGGDANGFTSATGQVVLSLPTIYGYITGRVTNASGGNFSGIKVFTSGSPQATTDAAGRYILPVSTGGDVTVTANYQNQGPGSSYVALSSMGITVELGDIKSDVDFALYLGGQIRGLVTTTSGVDALPGIPVVGLKNDIEQGTGVSGSDGYFMISGLSTGTYGVVPQLEAGEVSTPSSQTVTLTAGGTVTLPSSFTVTGAFGYITGAVSLGSVGGPPITTGVLICATTATITSDPPAINSSLRSGNVVYYADSSTALGTYNIPVKGGFNYRVYAWYTTWESGVPSTVRRDTGATAFTVNPSATVVKNFFW